MIELLFLTELARKPVILDVPPVESVVILAERGSGRREVADGYNPPDNGGPGTSTATGTR